MNVKGFEKYRDLIDKEVKRVRIQDDLYAELQILANQDCRTVEQQVNYMLKKKEVVGGNGTKFVVNGIKEPVTLDIETTINPDLSPKEKTLQQQIAELDAQMDPMKPRQFNEAIINKKNKLIKSSYNHGESIRKIKEGATGILTDNGNTAESIADLRG